MTFEIPETLENEMVKAMLISPEHFDLQYAAGSDPLIWEQHPNKNRYTLEGFSNYFDGAVKSGMAYLITDAGTGEVIGSSRYSIRDDKEISIGYTFFKCSHWRKGYNRAMKKLMIDHAFKYVDEVYFYIGAVNKRSQESIEKLGAVKVREEATAYFGEAPKLDYVYAIKKSDWEKDHLSENI